MGVPEFFKYISNNPLFKSSVSRNLPSNVQITHLCIDVNPLIHNNAQIIFEYGQNAKVQTAEYKEYKGVVYYNENEFTMKKYRVFERVFNDIKSLNAVINPTETLMIAIDGVAPQSKILQQRFRRYKSASSRREHQVFDSNCISPGTTFMRELDSYIQDKLKTIKSTNDPSFPPNIVYSSHLVYGEGEHKIADYLKSLNDLYKKNVVVHGLDADLIMIYSLMINNLKRPNVRNVFLVRTHDENYKITSTVNCGKILENVSDLYPTSSPMDDFVLLLFFVGNDFLPKFQSFEVVHNTLDTLIYGYKLFLNENPQMNLVSNGKINWISVMNFISFIAGKYEDILLEKWATDPSIKIPSPLLTHPFNAQKFKELWYKYIFSPKSDSTLILESPTQNDKNRMFKSYIEGMVWTYNYYKTGIKSVNNLWYYPFHYAPIFSDLADYIYDTIKTGDHDKWDYNTVIETSLQNTVLEQMLQILPPQSIDLVPETLKVFYGEESVIYDLFPNKFLSDSSGKLIEHEAVALIPIPNPTRITRALEYIQLPEKLLSDLKFVENYIITRDLGQYSQRRNAPQQFQKYSNQQFRPGQFGTNLPPNVQPNQYSRNVSRDTLRDNPYVPRETSRDVSRDVPYVPRNISRDNAPYIPRDNFGNISRESSQYNRNEPQYNRNQQYNRNEPQYNVSSQQYNRNEPQYNRNEPQYNVGSQQYNRNERQQYNRNEPQYNVSNQQYNQQNQYNRQYNSPSQQYNRQYNSPNQQYNRQYNSSNQQNQYNARPSLLRGTQSYNQPPQQSNQTLLRGTPSSQYQSQNLSQNLSQQSQNQYQYPPQNQYNQYSDSPLFQSSQYPISNTSQNQSRETGTHYNINTSPGSQYQQDSPSTNLKDLIGKPQNIGQLSRREQEPRRPLTPESTSPYSGLTEFNINQDIKINPQDLFGASNVNDLFGSNNPNELFDANNPDELFDSRDIEQNARNVPSQQEVNELTLGMNQTEPELNEQLNENEFQLAEPLEIKDDEIFDPLGDIDAE